MKKIEMITPAQVTAFMRVLGREKLIVEGVKRLRSEFEELVNSLDVKDTIVIRMWSQDDGRVWFPRSVLDDIIERFTRSLNDAGWEATVEVERDTLIVKLPTEKLQEVSSEE